MPDITSTPLNDASEENITTITIGVNQFTSLTLRVSTDALERYRANHGLIGMIGARVPDLIFQVKDLLNSLEDPALEDQLRIEEQYWVPLRDLLLSMRLAPNVTQRVRKLERSEYRFNPDRAHRLEVHTNALPKCFPKPVDQATLRAVLRDGGYEREQDQNPVETDSDVPL